MPQDGEDQLPPGRHLPMGPDHDPMAVLDERCRVRGADALRVIDASIMPAIVSGNTNGPTLALADRAVTLMMGGTQ